MALSRPIALVVLPVPPDQPGQSPTTASGVQFFALDRFADALRRHTAAEVLLVEDSLRAAPDGALVLLEGGLDASRLEGCDPDLPRRIMLLNATRPPALLDELERWKLAGAIERVRYSDWRAHPERETGGGLFGLRSVADRMGATCFESTVFASEHYCSLRSDRAADLPALVVRYLEALAEELGEAGRA